MEGKKWKFSIESNEYRIFPMVPVHLHTQASLNFTYTQELKQELIKNFNGNLKVHSGILLHEKIPRTGLEKVSWEHCLDKYIFRLKEITYQANKEYDNILFTKSIIGIIIEVATIKYCTQNLYCLNKEIPGARLKCIRDIYTILFSKYTVNIKYLIPEIIFINMLDNDEMSAMWKVLMDNSREIFDEEINYKILQNMDPVTSAGSILSTFDNYDSHNTKELDEKEE